MIEVDKLTRQADAFGIGTNSLRDATAGYIAVLADLPADLIPVAFFRAWSHHKYGMRLPLPGEVRNAVTEEFNERVARLAKLEAMSRAKVEDDRPAPRPSEAEKAGVASLVADLVRGLRA